jgi:hypothetical protein
MDDHGLSQLLDDLISSNVTSTMNSQEKSIYNNAPEFCKRLNIIVFIGLIFY